MPVRVMSPRKPSSYRNTLIRIATYLGALVSVVCCTSCPPSPPPCPCANQPPAAPDPTNPSTASSAPLEQTAPRANAAAGASPAVPPKDEAGLRATYEAQPALEVLGGKAVYYGDSLAGNKTANGEVYDPRQFTAAHRSLPFNTVVRVIRVDTGRYVYVRITDRGPFGNADRIIDLSRIAAERLDMIRRGVIDVRLEVVSKSNP